MQDIYMAIKTVASPLALASIVAMACGQSAGDIYLKTIPQAFLAMAEERERCAITRDQHCLTLAQKKLRDDIGPKAPTRAAWMADFHTELYDVMGDVVQIHERAEAGESAESYGPDLETAMERMSAAFNGWLQAAER